MPKLSAGLLPFRTTHDGLELFLVHPGGPFWVRKDDGAWSIAKGEYQDGEEPLAAARREFAEETGFVAAGPWLDLGQLRQPGGKLVRAWAERADYRPEDVRSNGFTLEGPRGSGQQREFPEVDRAGWFAVAAARRKLLKGQLPFIQRLLALLAEAGDGAAPSG